VLTFQSIQSQSHALAQLPDGGVHRQQRRAFLVGARGIWRFLPPVPTRRRRAAPMSADGGLGRAARGARGSITIPSATARRYLRPRPPHRALGTCGSASRTGNSPRSRPVRDAPPPRREIGILSFLTSFLPASLSTIPTNQQRSKSEADAESKVCVLLTFYSGGSVRRRHSPAHLHTSTKQALRRISTRRSSRKRSQAYVTFPRVQHRREALAKTKNRTGTYRVSPLKNKIARCRTLSTPFARRRRTDSSSSSRRNTFKPTW